MSHDTESPTPVHSPVGPMTDAVNAHVIDHLVNGPAAHRELMDAAQLQDAIRADLLAFLEGLLPQPADHAPVEGDDEWVQCSENENGHPLWECPVDLSDEAECYADAGEIRALIAKAKGAA